jgi:DNA polymerase-3 subunit epsilon
MQQSFDALGQPLSETTFCVLDIETTGGGADAAITEIGAVKLRGGECLGTFQTLINPGVDIPPSITLLTGITYAMVAPAPFVNEVIETFLDFVGESVIVGHNVRFDLRFLNGALKDNGLEAFPNTVVDTCSLARRLVRDEVRNCKLHTLAEYFGLRHQPSHRALDDAQATGELLHCLLERAGSLGVCGLSELVALPTVGTHPNLAKLTLTQKLPRTPGVYLFKNANNDILYVGKANNIRQRVRSYFTGDDRRKVGRLLHEVAKIDAVPTINSFAAGWKEIRYIHKHEPHYNYQVKNWRKYAYVALTLEEKYPRLIVSRTQTRDDRFLIGPLSSKQQAQTVIDALHTVSRLRRCTRVPRGKQKISACLAAQLGVTDCPCTGEVTPEKYANTVHDFIATLTEHPEVFIEKLFERMEQLAAQQRFEDAAEIRNRIDLLSRILNRQSQLFSLRRLPELTLRMPDNSFVRIEHGAVKDVVHNDELAIQRHTCNENCPSPLFIPPREVDELLYLARFIEKYRNGISVVNSSEPWSFPETSLPRAIAKPGLVESSVSRRYADAVA